LLFFFFYICNNNTENIIYLFIHNNIKNIKSSG